jgi:hypothetical protein
MCQKLYLILTGIVFLTIGLLHLLRLINHWPIVVGTTEIPMALSYFGLPICVAYAVWAGWLVRDSIKKQN